MIRAIVKFGINLCVSILFRIKKYGVENIPKDGAYILAPKHLSNWDAPVLVAKTKRNDMVILAKQELFKNSFIKFMARRTNVLPVNRNAHDTTTIKTTYKALKEGKILLIFPEGTRKGIEKGKKIHSGTVVIANMANVPIIPVGINTKYKPFSKVIINYGKPIYVGKEKLEKEEINNITERLKNDIIQLTNIEK